MSKGSNRRPGDGYEDNHARIFGNKPVQRGSWVYDAALKKMMPKDEYVPPKRELAVHGDIESFKSPIDGSVITDRAQLREHNRKHGVTDSRDYGAEHFERKTKEREDVMQGNTKQAKQGRINDILKAINQQRGR